eukprot:1694807-Rhodomonas_salina.1
MLEPWSEIRYHFLRRFARSPGSSTTLSQSRALPSKQHRAPALDTTTRCISTGHRTERATPLPSTRWDSASKRPVFAPSPTTVPGRPIAPVSTGHRIATAPRRAIPSASSPSALSRSSSASRPVPLGSAHAMSAPDASRQRHSTITTCYRLGQARSRARSPPAPPFLST